MERFLLAALLIFTLSGYADAAILVMSTNGTYTTKTTLEVARTAADVAGKTVVVTSPQTISANLTWPADRTLEIKQGGVVTVNAGVTLTINGTFSAGNYQVFSGSGSVTGLKEARLEWFGAKGDGIQDDTAAFNKAIAASRVVKISTPSNFYNVTSPIKLPSLTSLRGEWNRTTFVGDVHQLKPGIRKTTNTTVAIAPNAGGAVVNIDCIFYIDPVTVTDIGNGFYTQKIEIRDLNIQGAAGSLVEHAIYVDQGGNFTFENLDITDVKYAFYGVSVWSSTFTNVHAQARIFAANGTSLKFDSCSSGGSSHGFDGFYLNNVLYSSMINCTSDGAHESSYTFKTCYGVTLIGCGTEGADSIDANVGTAFNFLGGNQITVQGATIVTTGTKPKTSVMAGDVITFNDFSSFAGSGTGADVYVNNDASGAAIPPWVSFNNSYFTDFSLWNPTIVFAAGTNTAKVTVNYKGTNTKVYSAAKPAGVKYGNESGTWTPTIIFGSGSTGITYTVQSGTYTINGNTITAQGTIVLSSKGTSTGAAYISGLPFIIGSQTASGFIGYQDNVLKRMHPKIAANDPNMFLYDESINSTLITDADFLNNSTLNFTVQGVLPDIWGNY